MKAIETFHFKQCSHTIKSTGKKAKSLRELLKLIVSVSDASLYHHTYQYFLKGHIQEYTNDFAQWAGECLEERALAEHLANIDPYNFKKIAALRERLAETINDYLTRFPEPREVIPGNEFYFNETITLIFPAGTRARNLAEFFVGIRNVDTGSIYYHFYEARIRLGSGIDDFSKWLEDSLGLPILAAKIRSIDPFMHTTEGIREHIVEAVETELKREMEP